jgi:hypothetical protein
MRLPRPRKAKAEDWETRLGTGSFNPLEILELSDAVRERRGTVVIGGTNYALSYRNERVFYCPVEGFIPCGWLEISRIERGF